MKPIDCLGPILLNWDANAVWTPSKFIYHILLLAIQKALASQYLNCILPETPLILG